MPEEIENDAILAEMIAYNRQFDQVARNGYATNASIRADRTPQGPDKPKLQEQEESGGVRSEQTPDKVKKKPAKKRPARNSVARNKARKRVSAQPEPITTGGGVAGIVGSDL